jgi:hypothetical protein
LKSTSPTFLYRFRFYFCAMLALVNGDQLSLFDIKLFFFENFPLMETTAAQGVAFMPFGYFWPLKLNNIPHRFFLDYFLAITFQAASQVCDK